MVTEEKIRKFEPIYVDIFEDKFQVFSEYSLANNLSIDKMRKIKISNILHTELNEKELIEYNKINKINILYAYYSYEDYNGDSFVIFEEDGKLYEVNGSHCSCFGLEDQWDPEPVVEKELINRLNNGLTYMSDEHKEQLLELLE